MLITQDFHAWHCTHYLGKWVGGLLGKFQVCHWITVKGQKLILCPSPIQRQLGEQLKASSCCGRSSGSKANIVRGRWPSLYCGLQHEGSIKHLRKRLLAWLKTLGPAGIQACSVLAYEALSGLYPNYTSSGPSEFFVLILDQMRTELFEHWLVHRTEMFPITQSYKLLWFILSACSPWRALL